MTFHRTSSLWMTALLSASLLLAGCGKKADPKPSSVSSQSTSSAAPQIDEAAQTVARMEIIRQSPAETPADLSGFTDEQIRSCFYSLPLDEQTVSLIDKDMYDTAQTFITPDQLRLVRVLYKDFQGQTKTGELLCNQMISQDLEEIFYELYSINYPIERVVLPYGYGMNDEAVMSADITRCLAFTWTDGMPDEHEHSLGLAVDFNSLYNPQVISDESGTIVLPAAAAAYADRSVLQPHMMDENDPAVAIFRNHGFTWGGVWEGRNDYQHFEKYFNHDTGHADPTVFYQ